MHGLSSAHARQKQIGLQMVMHGVGMPNGPLEPRDPPHPRGLGYPMAPLYAGALSSVNVPISSLFNCRLGDCFFAGVVQFIRDRWGELPRLGFVDGEHYISFDGTTDDLLGKVEMLRAQPERAAEMVGRAHERAIEFWKDNGWESAYRDIYFHHLEQLT